MAANSPGWGKFNQVSRQWRWHTMKLLLTVALVGCVGSFAGPVIAQSKQGEASGKDISSQCAHRRIMPPDPHDDCARKVRSDAQVGGGLGGASTTSSSYSQSSE